MLKEGGVKNKKQDGVCNLKLEISHYNTGIIR